MVLALELGHQRRRQNGIVVGLRLELAPRVLHRRLEPNLQFVVLRLRARRRPNVPSFGDFKQKKKGTNLT